MSCKYIWTCFSMAVNVHHRCVNTHCDYLQYEFCLSTFVLDLVYWISYGIWYEVHLCVVDFCVYTLKFWIFILQGVVECLKIVTKAKSERIAKFAFDYATRNNRKKVTAVHKANIMKLGDGLFLKSCQEVCSKQNYRNILSGHLVVFLFKGYRMKWEHHYLFFFAKGQIKLC